MFLRPLDGFLRPFCNARLTQKGRGRRLFGGERSPSCLAEMTGPILAPSPLGSPILFSTPSIRPFNPSTKRSQTLDATMIRVPETQVCPEATKEANRTPDTAVSTSTSSANATSRVGNVRVVECLAGRERSELAEDDDGSFTAQLARDGRKVLARDSARRSPGRRAPL